MHECGWSSKYAFAYIKDLDEKDLWPAALDRRSIVDAIAEAEFMPDPIPTEDSGNCQYDFKHSVPQYRRAREHTLGQLKDNLGLCLHCVRAGDGNAATCQVSHDHKD